MKWKLILAAFLLLNFAAFGQSTCPTPLYQQAIAATLTNQNLANRSLVCIVDFSKPSYEKRLWVVDLKTGKCLINTWVSHGKGTGRSATAELFSNTSGSECSSLGFFVPKEEFNGKHGLSLRLAGLDKGVNDNAEARGIIFHAASYVNSYNATTYKRQGNSQGCFAVAEEDIRKVIDLLKGGSAFIMAVADMTVNAATVATSGKGSTPANLGK
jgi:hypothetical protein